MKTLSTTWTGIRPLVLHNGRMADPTNPFTRKIKAITSKKNKTDADFEAVARLEWEAGLYTNDDGALIIPTDNIERCIQLGAQKNRLGKDVAAVVFVVEDEITVEYDGPKTLDKMYADPQIVLRKGVKVTTARIIRVRPMVPTGWKLKFELEFDDSILNTADLQKAMIDAGALIGLGDFRPKFGRFLVK